MKRFVLQGLLFTAITALLYVVSVGVLAKTVLLNGPLIYRTSDYYHWKGGCAYQKYREFDPAAEWDVLVVGSSHAYRGYDPRVFGKHGYRLFNLGSSSQTPLNSYHVLKAYADTSRTRLVIFDMYENTFDTDGLESVSELTQDIGSDAAAVGMAWSVKDLRALNMVTLRLFTRSEPATYLDSTYITAGYAAHTDSAHGTVRYDLGRPLAMRPAQKEYFIRTLELCAERGLPVVLVSHFSPHQSDRARHAAFARYVDSVARAHDVRYLDFAYAHALSDTDHFYDHNHLNEAGANIFNERLVDSLAKHGLLPMR